jgi:hypothetical protein
VTRPICLHDGTAQRCYLPHAGRQRRSGSSLRTNTVCALSSILRIDERAAVGTLDVFDDLIARAFACSSCLSHLPLLSGYDEPRTLSYEITLFGPISADVRQKGSGIWVRDPQPAKGSASRR